MVDPNDNHLVDIIDWAKAKIGPFRTKLHSLQQFMSKYSLSVGWIGYDNYNTLDNKVWGTFSAGTGVLYEQTIQTIKSAMIVGLLLSHGFTSRLSNMPEPEPIRDNESGAYGMLGLDDLLINPAMKLDYLENVLVRSGHGYSILEFEA